MDHDKLPQEPATILVVDDTPANLSLMTGLLRDEYKEAYEKAQASAGAGA